MTSCQNIMRSRETLMFQRYSSPIFVSDHSHGLFSMLPLMSNLSNQSDLSVNHATFPILSSLTVLGAWVRRQQKSYEMGALHEDQIKILRDVGFLFLRKKVASSFDPWATLVSELKAFKEANGHVDVPRLYALNSSLGIWVQNQRLAQAGRKLSESQIKILDDLGLGFNFTLQSRPTKPLKLWE